MLEDLGNLSATMVAKELGKRWSSVDPGTKARFEEIANDEKKRYAETMRKYKPSAEFLQKVKNMKGSVKKVKDTNAPKRPISAYFLWCGEERKTIKEEQGNLSTPLMAKELGKRWISVGPQTRARFQNLADMEKEKYKVAMKNYSPQPAGQSMKMSGSQVI